MTIKIEESGGKIHIVRSHWRSAAPGSRSVEFSSRHAVTRGDLERLVKLHDWHNGACKCSEWTHGRGKWITLQKLPPFAEKITVADGIRLGGWVGRTCRRMQRESPQLQFVIAITDLRRARQVLKKATHGHTEDIR